MGSDLPYEAKFYWATNKGTAASMSLPKKMRGFYISCQQELFPCVEQNYGVVPKRFRKLLLVFELVCVEDCLPRPRLRWVGRQLVHRVCLALSFQWEDLGSEKLRERLQKIQQLQIRNPPLLRWLRILSITITGEPTKSYPS